MSLKYFLDTNVFVYTFDEEDSAKNRGGDDEAAHR